MMFLGCLKSLMVYKIRLGLLHLSKGLDAQIRSIRLEMDVQLSIERFHLLFFFLLFGPLKMAADYIVLT